MEITWLGHSSFRIKGKDVTIVTDPAPKTMGYNPGRVTADVITISHGHPGHSFIEGVSDTPKVLQRPGEYEIGNALIRAIPTYHDSERGAKLGKNIIYRIEIDQVLICHLGDLGHTLTPDQMGELTGVEILFVPVGGKSSLDGASAAQMVRLLEPRIVIPMHFKTPTSTADLDTAERFLKEMGTDALQSQPKLLVTKTTLPPNTQVILLEHK